MGLADLLGTNNPFQQFVASNRGVLGQIGAGLGSGQNFSAGLANAAQNMPLGRQQDDAYATAKKEEAKRQDSLNQTIKFMRDRGYNDLVAAAQSGQMNEAWTEALKRSAPGYAQEHSPKPIEVGGVLLDPTTYQPIFDSRKPESAPAGYRYQPDGTMAFIPGGPADPSTAGKTTEATRRNQQLAKVIEPEAAALLGNPATGTPGTFDALANTGNQGWNAVGLGSVATSPEYQQAQNSLKTIIASYLYSVSGATANPGEVENQAAILTPRPGESAQSVADKKDRIAVMVKAVQEAATGASMAPQTGGQGNTGDGWEVIGVQ